MKFARKSFRFGNRQHLKQRAKKIFEAEAKKRNLPVDKFVETELAKRRGNA